MSSRLPNFIHSPSPGTPGEGRGEGLPGRPARGAWASRPCHITASRRPLKRTLLSLLGLCIFLIGAEKPNAAADPRFFTTDIIIDSGKIPLAAWQVEFKATAGDVQIVGVERGDDANFRDPPYYDAEALYHGRIVIGSFNTTDQLPAGAVRVARLHLRSAGGVTPVFEAKVIVAGGKDGTPIQAKVTIKEGVSR